MSVGNLVSGGDSGHDPGADHHRLARPDLFYFDMSEADYLAYQRATADGKLGQARGRPPSSSADRRDGWPHKGSSNFVDNRVDPRRRDDPRPRELPNSDFLSRPGSSARIRIRARASTSAILIPDGAVVTDQSRKVVMTVKDDGTVEPKVVRPGRMTDGACASSAPASTPTDRVIINGLVRARPGAKVTPQPGKIETAAQP